MLSGKSVSWRLPKNCSSVANISSGTATASGERLEIQATWGLGHSLLQGEVDPDLYTEEAFPWKYLEWTLKADAAQESPQWSIVQLIATAKWPNIPITSSSADEVNAGSATSTDTEMLEGASNIVSSPKMCGAFKVWREPPDTAPCEGSPAIGDSFSRRSTVDPNFLASGIAASPGRVQAIAQIAPHPSSAFLSWN